MKLLWIFTLAISIFFAYHTYTHTRLRYKDLESVMQQNLAMENSIVVKRKNTQKQLKKCEELTFELGDTPKDVAIVNKAKLIKNYTDSILNKLDTLTFVESSNENTRISLQPHNILLLNTINTTFPAFVSKQDSSLHEINGFMTLIKWDNTACLPILIGKQRLGIKSRATQIESKSVDKLTSQVGSVSSHLIKIIPLTAIKSQTVRVGNNYEAQMFISASSTQIKPKMQISEGKVKVRGNIGYIEIPNTKAQNYNSEGKATKTLSGKITIKKSDGNDTTFTLSTNYTVKQLVN